MLVKGWEAYTPWRHEYEGLIDETRHPLQWLDGQVFTGAIEAWACRTAGMLARVDTYPTGLKEVHCMAAAGDLAGIMELRPVVEQWGRDQGCAAAVVESRAGWLKALGPEGYHLHQTSIRKEL